MYKSNGNVIYFNQGSFNNLTLLSILEIFQQEDSIKKHFHSYNCQEIVCITLHQLEYHVAVNKP